VPSSLHHGPSTATPAMPWVLIFQKQARLRPPLPCQPSQARCQKSTWHFPDICTRKAVPFPRCHRHPGLDSLRSRVRSTWCAPPYGTSWILQPLLAPIRPAPRTPAPLPADTGSRPDPPAQSQVVRIPGLKKNLRCKKAASWSPDLPENTRRFLS